MTVPLQHASQREREGCVLYCFAPCGRDIKSTAGHESGFSSVNDAHSWCTNAGEEQRKAA
jgi:hypothetical protein